VTWTPVLTGLSGAQVWRAPGLFRKTAEPAAIAAEAERLTWLAGQGIPCPRIVELTEDTLTTTAVPGRPAAELSAPHLFGPRLAGPERGGLDVGRLVSAERARQDRAVESIAGLIRALHAIQPRDCPFERPLAQAIAEAAASEPDLDNLDEQRHGWTAERLLDELHRTRPAAADPVVCHGDLTLDNVLVDDAGAVTGLVDVGGLAVADRYQDLALITRDLLEWSPEHAERFLSVYGLAVVDRSKLDFYRLLDEFF
jgi:aminoglycoside phosphotransferase